jgi:hypothetical protein
MVWYSEKGCYLHGLWMFLLESAKDRFIVVDPPPLKQHVPLLVRYGTTCSLIMEPLGMCLARDQWGMVWLYLGTAWCKRGPRGGNLSRMQDLPKVPFVTACSDLLASYQRKCECAWPAWQHGGSLVIKR